MLVEILAASALIMLVSLSGKLVTWRGAGPLIERNLHFFVSFAAGVLLIVVYNLVVEIIEHAGSLLAGAPWIVLGAIAILALFHYLPTFHHHHDTHDTHSHALDANRILVSDGIHNVSDGVVIAISFAVSPVVGFANTLSIMVHEMLQEISEFFVLREAGLRTAQALLYNFISSATILIGALGAYFLLERFQVLEIPLLGLAAGSYLVVIFHDLIPHSFSSATEKGHYFKHVGFFVVGIACMALIALLLPHAG